MPELGPYGSVRGARGNSRPYRESILTSREMMRSEVAELARTSGKDASLRIRGAQMRSALASARATFA